MRASQQRPICGLEIRTRVEYCPSTRLFGDLRFPIPIRLAIAVQQFCRWDCLSRGVPIPHDPWIQVRTYPRVDQSAHSPQTLPREARARVLVVSQWMWEGKLPPALQLRSVSHPQEYKPRWTCNSSLSQTD